MKENIKASSMIAAEAAYEINPSAQMDMWVDNCSIEYDKSDFEYDNLRQSSKIADFKCRMKKSLERLIIKAVARFWA